MMRRRPALLILALVAMIPAAAQAGPAPERASAGAIAARGVAPFELIDRVIYVRGSINGSRPLWLLISSGSGQSAVDEAVARELDLRSAGSARLALGGAELPIENVAVVDLSAAEDQIGHEVDAVIGYDLFSRFVVEIDYYGQILRLHDPASFRPDPRFASLPLRIDGRRAYLRAGVELAGLPAFQRDYRLDTGLGGALADEAVRDATSPKIEIVGEAAGEPSAVTLTRTKAVQLGPFRFAGANGFAGEASVGGELLRRFTTIIDYGAGRLSLLPNRHYGDRFCFEMLGVELSLARDAGGMRIDAIYRGSTAEQAGLKVGDILTSVDGRPTSDFSLGQVRMMFGQQNSYVLTILHGAAVRHVPVTLSPAL
jgi:hypothetical protein